MRRNVAYNEQAPSGMPEPISLGLLGGGRLAMAASPPSQLIYFCGAIAGRVDGRTP